MVVSSTRTSSNIWQAPKMNGGKETTTNSTADDDNGGWGRPRPKPSFLSNQRPIKRETAAQPISVRLSENNGEDMDLTNEDNRDADVESRRCMPLTDDVLSRLDGVPKQELHQTYVNPPPPTESRVSIPQDVKSLTQAQAQEFSKKYFTTWTIREAYSEEEIAEIKKSFPKQQNLETRFACVVTCPVTGEHFSCGNWKNGKAVVDLDGTFWHQKKMLAEHAAAARALDCFSLRRCHGTGRKPSQRCLDAPYLTKEDAPSLPKMPEKLELPSALISFDNDVTPMVLEVVDEGSSTPQMDKPPKEALKEHYHSLWKYLLNHTNIDPKALPIRVVGEESYASWSNHVLTPYNIPEKPGIALKKDKRLFTAVFVCPWTGERFPSGKLIGQENNYVEDVEENWKICCPSAPGEDTFRQYSDKLIWYRTKKEAETAAAARAVDCFNYRHRGNENLAKYCLEEPYAKDAVPEPWKTISESVMLVYDIEQGSKKGEEMRLIPFHVYWPSVTEEELLSSLFGEEMDINFNQYEEMDAEREEYRDLRRAGMA